MTDKSLSKEQDAIPAHHFISLACANSGMTNNEIAEKAGFSKGNVVAMIRNGSMKLPINRVIPMANALGLDHIVLLRKVMSEADRQLLEVIQTVLGARAVSANELILVEKLRALSGNLDIDWTSRPEFMEPMTAAIDAVRSRESKGAKAAMKKLVEADGRFGSGAKKRSA